MEWLRCIRPIYQTVIIRASERVLLRAHKFRGYKQVRRQVKGLRRTVCVEHGEPNPCVTVCACSRSFLSVCTQWEGQNSLFTELQIWRPTGNGVYTKVIEGVRVYAQPRLKFFLCVWVVRQALPLCLVLRPVFSAWLIAAAIIIIIADSTIIYY